MREGSQTAANRTDSSNLARKFCYIKDLPAVRRVSSEPVSHEIPCYMER